MESTTPIPSTAPTVLVAVTGGIAAYKAVDLVSRLRKTGAEVYVAMSEAARNFVAPLTFSAVSGHRVLDHMWPERPGEDLEDLYPHLYPATNADAFVLAPATANMLARIARGLGDDLVSTCALSLPSRCARFFCPAMNLEMWENEHTQQHAARLVESGWRQIGPDTGFLACGMVGAGRMSDPADIAATVSAALQEGQRLTGRRVLVLSGPTHEHLDPVRFIGNASSGRMGKALAEEAAAQGAEVEFITGPVDERNMPRGPRIQVHPVISAEDMLAAAQPLYAQADLAIFAAAVADYRPAETAMEKESKSTEAMNLALLPTPDIAVTLNRNKRPDQVAVGFALQTDNGFEIARTKLRTKGFDGIVLNHLDAMGGQRGRYAYLGAGGDGAFTDWGDCSKPACARLILKEACRILPVK